jgi:hypothetical protein
LSLNDKALQLQELLSNKEIDKIKDRIIESLNDTLSRLKHSRQKSSLEYQSFLIEITNKTELLELINIAETHMFPNMRESLQDELFAILNDPFLNDASSDQNRITLTNNENDIDSLEKELDSFNLNDDGPVSGYTNETLESKVKRLYKILTVGKINNLKNFISTIIERKFTEGIKEKIKEDIKSISELLSPNVNLINKGLLELIDHIQNEVNIKQHKEIDHAISSTFNGQIKRIQAKKDLLKKSLKELVRSAEETVTKISKDPFIFQPKSVSKEIEVELALKIMGLLSLIQVEIIEKEENKEIQRLSDNAYETFANFNSNTTLKEVLKSVQNLNNSEIPQKIVEELVNEVKEILIDFISNN